MITDRKSIFKAIHPPVTNSNSMSRSRRRMGRGPSIAGSPGDVHQGARVPPAADPGWVHLRSGTGWQDHVYLGDSQRSSWTESGKEPPK